MEKISLRICAGLWIVASALLLGVAVLGGILLTSLFIFSVVAAAGYNWFHSQKYGELMLISVGLPDSTIEFVDTTQGGVNEHDGVYFHPDAPPELIQALTRLRKEGTLVRVLLGTPATGKVEAVQVGLVTWTPGAVAVPRLTRYDGLGGEVLEDHRIVRIINVVTSAVEYEGAGTTRKA
jgi:hypothetical protein